MSFIGNTTEELYIPDRFFKSVLFSAGFDMDGDDVLTRADAIAWNNGTQAKELDISRINITSLEGIQYFSALTKLDCSYKNISKISIIGYGIMNDATIITKTMQILDTNALEVLNIQTNESKIRIIFKDKLGDNILEQLHNELIV